MTPWRESPGARSLAEAYAQNKEKPVAYLDESYRTRADRPEEEPFYLITAVIIDPEDRGGLSASLIDIAGGGWWHTTELLRTESGREKVMKMSNYLGEGAEPCLVACKVGPCEGDDDPEKMRRLCMFSLMKALWDGSDLWPAVELMVLERRRDTSQVGADQRTLALAKQHGIVGRAARLQQVSPTDEKLLWLPDLVSSATRRKIVHGDARYYNEFAGLVHHIIAP